MRDIAEIFIGFIGFRQCKKKNFGAALATVLMVMMLASVLAFTLAGTGLFHLNVSARTDNAMQARNYAESAVSQAIEKVIKNTNYGTAREVTETIEIKENNTIVGELTFNQDEAKKRNIPYSTNNIQRNESTPGDNLRTVPKNSLHLVGVSKYHGIIKRIEAIIHAPPFPFCIASSGKFSSDGKLLVGTVNSSADILSGIDPKKLLPGHLVSNSNASDAVTLNGEGRITGDLQISGDIKISPSSKVEVQGEIRRHAEPADIIPIKIESYDPQGKDGVQNLSTFLDNPKLEGYCRVTGSLSVAGDLNLNGALLYVDGDLSVPSGCVKGKGAVVVKGKTTISKGADISSDNLVALLSGGDVTPGRSASSAVSSFQGVVYTEGNFRADSINLLGAFISNGQSTAIGNVVFNNTNIVNVTDYSNVVVKKEIIKTPSSLSGSITFNYANDSRYPEFKLTVTDSGSYELSYTPTDPNDKKYLGKILSFATIEDTALFLAKWWDYCEDNSLYKGANVNGPNWKENDWDVTSDEEKAGFPRIKQTIAKFLNDRLAKAVTNTSSGTTGGSTEIQEIFNLDMSNFLNMEDRMRIILWREI